MKLTSHLTEAIYRRYAIVSERDLAEGVKKLADLNQGQPSPPPEKKKVAGGKGNLVAFLKNWVKNG